MMGHDKTSAWNGGSGFYKGDNIGGREAIRKTTSPRFAAYRFAARDHAAVIGDAGEGTASLA
jgi:hypothetical protein